ncbi:MAG: hypothetical protein WEB88_12385 [Gemmatimonadota bacterium]
MAQEHLIYNGVRVIAGWPEQIEAAQSETAVVVNGVLRSRVPYGQEGGRWTADRACHDCAVVRGQYHVPGCDVERCPACGDQLIGCDCEFDGHDEE